MPQLQPGGISCLACLVMPPLPPSNGCNLTPKWQVSCSNSFAISQAPKHTMASMKLQQGARAAAMKQQQGSVAVRVNSRGPVVRGVQQASLVAAAASVQSASFSSSRTAQRVVRSRCVFRVRFCNGIMQLLHTFIAYLGSGPSACYCCCCCGG